MGKKGQSYVLALYWLLQVQGQSHYMRRKRKYSPWKIPFLILNPQHRDWQYMDMYRIEKNILLQALR